MNFQIVNHRSKLSYTKLIINTLSRFKSKIKLVCMNDKTELE